jgi:hypothetical protein
MNAGSPKKVEIFAMARESAKVLAATRLPRRLALAAVLG